MTTRLFVMGMALALLAACQTTGEYEPVAPELPQLKVTFGDTAWDGKTVPKGQHCRKFGGSGNTPALVVEGVPAEANALIIEFNDRSYAPLSANGGHGKIRIPVSGGGKVMVPSAPGETAEMPDGMFLEARNRASGSYAAPGYLPPCSGGRGNAYFAEIKAVYKGMKEGEKGKLFAEGAIELGRY